jgi:hypothetical protein
MRRQTRQILIALVWLVAAPAAAYAQGSITGVVRDTSGAVLPGVTVEVSSPALIEKVRSAVTDGTGQYQITNLAPGTYAATYTLPGFATVRRAGIELTGTFTATVNAELRVGALEETVTVTGETPVVDVQSTTRQRVMDREILDTIPTGGDEYNLGVLVPGVSVSGGQDVGGGGTQTAFPALSVHGSRSQDTTHTMGGVSMTMLASSGGFQVVRMNPAATQEVTVDTAAGNAEHSVGGVRVNRIPREGGNTFNGIVMGGFANNAMQGSNFNDDLRNRGLRSPNSINKNWELNAGFGGPIRRDRLWFYIAAQSRGASQYVAGLFHDRNANNPNAWTFDPDLSRPVTNDQVQKDEQLRVTWQATPRNKIGVTWQEALMCYCPLDASSTRAVEATVRRGYPLQRIIQGDWASPITARLLLEVGGAVASSVSNVDPWTDLTLGTIGVTEQSTGLTYREAGDPYRSRSERVLNYRSALSYITGAHSFKVGMNHRSGYSTWTSVDFTPVSYRFNNGVPNQLTQRAFPFTLRTDVDHDLGVFAQDRWTVGGLTLTYGVRYDFYANTFPEQRVGPAMLAPTRNITFPVQKNLGYHDLTPKLGMAYDPFGAGKTAFKVSLNKYVVSLGAEAFAEGPNPIRNLVTSTTRSWNDNTFPVGDPRRGNFVADCNLVDANGNGECGQLANRGFGGVGLGATWDPDLLRGWGRRDYNWEFSAGVQQELLPRVAADVSYFRRWFGNFVATDNLAVAPTDFTEFSITAPADPRLPGGGGYAISGLYDLNPPKFGVPVNNFVTRADNFGKKVQYWHGVDLTISARPRSGLLLQGGTSTGRTVTDECEVVAKIPESLFGAQVLAANNTNVWLPASFCHQQSAFLTQLKFLGSYTIPRVDVQVSATLQSLPGPHILANYNAPNALIRPSLGRDLSAGANQNVTVNLIEPGTMYGERMNQLDLRVAKILRFGRTRTSLNVDLFNALNSNAVLTLNNNFAVWQQPTSILLARFVKLSAQIDF